MELGRIYYYEVCKQNGRSTAENIANGLYNEWDGERIKGAFRNGNGTMKDMIDYINNNRKYATFIAAENWKG